MKVCTSCLKLKPLTEYHVFNGKLGQLAYKCKPCANEYQKQYRRDNAKKISKKRKAAYAKNREQRIVASLAWQKNNPGKANAKNKFYKLSKKQRTPPWLTEQHKAQIAMFYEAAAKLTKELGIKFEVDHIMPLNGKDSSGLHVPWNLQVITKVENNKKSNKVEGL